MTRISSSALKIQNLYGVKKEFPLPVAVPSLYEIKPDQPAPVAVACRDAKSNPCFTRTVVLQITSMGNLSEK